MPQQAAAAEQENSQRLTPRGRPWPKGVSGNPAGSKLSKRVSALFESMCADFAELSAIDRAMILQASRLLCRSERADSDQAVKLSNAAARLLASLRKRQREPSAGPTLQEYLRDRYGAKQPADESNGESARGIAAAEETRTDEAPTADDGDSSDDDSNADEAMS